MSVACAFCKKNKQTTGFFETMTEVHKERKDFEKKNKEDLISECLKLNKLLLQLKMKKFSSDNKITKWLII